MTPVILVTFLLRFPSRLYPRNLIPHLQSQLFRDMKRLHHIKSPYVSLRYVLFYRLFSFLLRSIPSYAFIYF
ncbi:hypothetical protein F5Y03DRAFT_341295 [Xylaria venustula]|nr:hypothetical protein F5Y03DRAFT_341295 [Xylaria venustula]